MKFICEKLHVIFLLIITIILIQLFSINNSVNCNNFMRKNTKNSKLLQHRRKLERQSSSLSVTGMPITTTVTTTAATQTISNHHYSSSSIHYNNNNKQIFNQHYKSNNNELQKMNHNNINLIGEIDDTIYDDIEVVRILVSETFYDISASISKLAGDASYTIKIFWENTREFLISAKTNMNNILGVIASKLLDVTDDTLRCLFDNIRKQLEKIKIMFDELSDMADKEFENVMEHVNKSLINVSEDMEEWSKTIKTKLRSVKNDQTYKEGCEYIDNFINSSIAEMYQCCNIAIRPVKTICQRVRKIIEHTIELAVDIVDRIEKCILDRRIPPHIMVTCLNNGYDKFDDLIAEGMELKHNLMETLPIKIIISNFCISFATVSVEVRKNDISREFNKKSLRNI